MLKLREYYITKYGAFLGCYYWNLIFDYWYTEDCKVINLLKF